MMIFISGNNLYAQTADTLRVFAEPEKINDDSLSQDSIRVSDNDFKSKVIYSAEDSLQFDVENHKVYLYGRAIVKYEDMTLKANYIEVNLESKILFSTFTLDSAGSKAGIPDFEQAANKFTADEIRYNFITKKGRITGVYTQQGDGYIHGETVKKTENYEYIKNGLYTTCNLPQPHYGIIAGKLKVINNEKIVSGPAYLVIAGVPTPLAVPLGYFPTRKERSNGIVFPAYGESADLGFFLKNGGYYLGIGNFADVALTGDVYSRGSWGSQFYSQYANRYHYTGNLSLSYSKIRTGDPELPDFNFSKEFFIRWSHAQDPKARPNSVFSANVNAGSSRFYRVQVTSPNNYVTNTFQSSVSYNKTWAGKPYSFSSSISHNQNTQTRDINLSLPQAAFNVSRIYPFKKRFTAGEQKWYEKTGISYQANLLNQIQTKDSLLFTEDAIGRFRNGLQHTIPISTSVRVMKYFTLSPSINYNEKWYLQTVRKQFNTAERTVVTDTIRGFKAAREFSASASVNTRIYGMVAFKNSKITHLRHVISPSVSLSYRPDFSTPFWNYYKNFQSDSSGTQSRYSVFESGIFSGPSSGKQNLIGFGIDNNLEMKTKKITDSAEIIKKIKIFESLSLGSSYNIAADSLRWSNISISGRTTLLDKINLNMFGTFDPYITDSAGRRFNRSELRENKRLARLTNANLSIGYSFNNVASPKTTLKGSEADQKEIMSNPDEYVDLDVPFNVVINYSLNYSRFALLKPEVTQIINFSGDVSLTPNWKIIFSSGYDFKLKEATYTSLSFYRDLHCWEMRLNWVPLGNFTYWNFQINVKSSILQDLKWVKKQDPYDR